MNKLKIDKEVVIFTKYFGYNFTGATLATHELIKLWSLECKKIKIITKYLGENENIEGIENVEIIHCKTYKQMVYELNKTYSDSSIYYSDDHLAFILKIVGKKYFHTYHATWPEARWNNLEHFFKSFLFIPLYKIAIKNSIKEITVSNKYYQFVNKYNKNNCVIRNGLGRSGASNDKVIPTINDKKFNVVMIGNIDTRKYKLAIKLFNKIKKNKITDIKIDIYGRNTNKKMVKILEKYNFVEYKGFVSKVPINNYKLMLHTASNENLSIAICESLKNKVPVLCYDVGGLNEVVINKDNGVLIKKGKNKEMYNKLIDIKKGNINFKFSSRIIEEFEWTISSSKYISEFINEVNR